VHWCQSCGSRFGKVLTLALHIQGFGQEQDWQYRENDLHEESETSEILQALGLHYQYNPHWYPLHRQKGYEDEKNDE
jgi:hypothetical protein